jgi:hypothetical protein
LNPEQHELLSTFAFNVRLRRCVKDANGRVGGARVRDTLDGGDGAEFEVRARVVRRCKLNRCNPC